MTGDVNSSEDRMDRINEGNGAAEQNGSDRAEGERGARARIPARRGFAAMDPQAQRAIAAKGGRAAHLKGTAHEFTSEEARVAGRKGGEASRGGRRPEVSNSELEQRA